MAEVAVARFFWASSFAMDEALRGALAAGRAAWPALALADDVFVAALQVTGALLGTPAYMAPEQLAAGDADARADQFSYCVALYEALYRTRPFAGDTVAALVDEIRAGRIRTMAPTTPPWLRGALARGLATDPAARFPAMEALLDAFAVGLAQAPRGPIQVLVADFHNTTGEPLFDGALEITLAMVLEEAPLISSYPRGSASKLDEQAARQIAGREGIDAVVSGTIGTTATGLAISVRAVDPASGQVIARAERHAANAGDCLRAVGELATSLRRAFGDDSSEELQRSARERVAMTSLDAAHAYAHARDLLDAMDYRGAVLAMQHVIELDPDLGVAYTGLAAGYLNLGELDQARRAFDLAFSHIDRMTDRQQFVTRGMYYATQGEPKKALDVYKKMLARFPGDRVALRHLAHTHAILGQFGQALDVAGRILERSPQDLAARAAAASYALATGDFGGAIGRAKELIALHPDNAGARWTLGMAHVLRGSASDAAAVFRELQTMPGGASIGTLNLAEIAVLEGRTRDALEILEPGIAADLQHRDTYDAGVKEWLAGYVHRVRGETTEALAALDRAIPPRLDTTIAFLVAREYIALGALGKAKEIAAVLATRVDMQNRTSTQILEAELALEAGRPKDAIVLLDAAQQSIDTWLGTFDLGVAYLAAGAYPHAHEAFSACVQRRGELGILLALLPPTWYQLGRAQEGLHSPAAADSYRMYISARESADVDLDLDDARRRLAALVG
jgi:tetratricopeptide (TPR) repeat protein